MKDFRPNNFPTPSSNSGAGMKAAQRSAQLKNSPVYSEFYQLDQRQGNWVLHMDDNIHLNKVSYFDFKDSFGENLDAGNLVSFYDRV